MQLHQAVVAEFNIAGPVAVVECSARAHHRPLHVGDRSVVSTARDFSGARMNHLEHRVIRSVNEVTIDQHPRVADEQAGFALHSCHSGKPSRIRNRCQRFRPISGPKYVVEVERTSLI
jgi:hypothetical protein